MSVYVVRCLTTGLFKIGVANDPQARLTSLQTGSASPLELLFTIDGDGTLERELHEQYDRVRQRGEWFALEPDHLQSLMGRATLAMRANVREADRDLLAKMIKDPEIAEFIAHVLSVRDEGGKSFCPNRVWYGYSNPRTYGLKGDLKHLVGWSGSTAFRDEESYRVLYEYAYGLLPDCRNCGCWRPS